MNILLALEEYYPYVNGVISHVDMLRKGLEARGHHVMIMTCGTNNMKSYVKDNVLYCPAVKIKKIYNYGVTTPFGARRTRLLDDFRPDIVHIHNEGPVSLFAMNYALSRKIPLVYTLHTMYDEYYHYVTKSPLGQKVVRKFAYKYLHHFVIKADKVLSPSQKAVDMISRTHLNKPVTVIQNFIDTDLYDRSRFDEEHKQALRNSLGIQPDDTVGIFVGRLGQEKRINVLLEDWLEQFADKPDRKLLVIGGGPDEQKLRDFIAERKAEDRILLLGKLNHPEIPQYYAISDFYITASLSEMMSISLLEAMAMEATPIIAFDLQNQNQIQDGVTGFYFHNKDEMKQCIDDYLAMPEQRKAELRNNIRSKALELGIDKNVAVIDGFYRELVDKKRKPVTVG